MKKILFTIAITSLLTTACTNNTQSAHEHGSDCTSDHNHKHEATCNHEHEKPTQESFEVQPDSINS